MRSTVSGAPREVDDPAPPPAVCTLRVGGMDCSSCAESVDRALRSLAGVQDVRVDVVGGKVTVEYAEGKLARGDLVGAVTRVGYPARDEAAERREVFEVEGMDCADEVRLIGGRLGTLPGGGTLNGEGALEVRSTRPAADTTLARIIHSVEEAQASRAPSQSFVDRFARVYTPTVVAAAVALALLPPLLGLGGWGEWFYRALVLLVVACPCALVISTPVTIVSALAGAARRGILVKGGLHLENAGRVRVVALDKTGTLTEGVPMA